MTENVANNVAQANSQDLTEQWKKGKLPNGMYYIEFKDGDIAKDVYAFGSWGNISEHFLKQVLAPVPSYEEWQQLVQDYSDKHDKYLRLSQTNQQLHKFLEEFNALDVAEENEALKTKLSIQCEANEELRKENQQLKELLNECGERIESAYYFDGISKCDAQEILTKITYAIGEKK